MIINKLNDSQCQDACLLSDSKRYTVYAILLGEQTKFLVEEEDAFSFPFFVSAAEVKVINSAVSMYWKYLGPLDREQKCSSRPAMLACEKMLERFFYQKLVDGDLDVNAEWKLIKEQLDSEATL